MVVGLGYSEKMVLKTSPLAEWEGDLILLPQVAPDKAVLNKPGKRAGDSVLLDGDPPRLLVSLGTKEKMDAVTIRKAGIATAAWLESHLVSKVGIDTSSFHDLEFNVALDSFCGGLLYGAFQFDLHKSQEEVSNPIEVILLVDEGGDDIQAQIEHLTHTVNSVNLAREWSHEPPNIINPVTLAQRARDLASKLDLICTVFNQEELAKIGAGAIISVGQGSKTPSQMIILEYPGRGNGLGKPPVVVVGKAITFDTGGYSLKNTKGIVGMKFDKCGGMAVIGILNAAAALKLPVPVTGIIAAAENMISGEAYTLVNQRPTITINPERASPRASRWYFSRPWS